MVSGASVQVLNDSTQSAFEAASIGVAVLSLVAVIYIFRVLRSIWTGSGGTDYGAK